MASYKGLWSWIIACWRGNTVSAAADGHTTCLLFNLNVFVCFNFCVHFLDLDKWIPLFLELIRSTQFGRRAFAVCGPDIWNALPPAIRTTDSYPAFRCSLKHTYFILLLTSSYSCFYHWLCNARSADFFRITGHYNIYLWLWLWFSDVCDSGDAWVEVHHNMAVMSDSIKAQLAGALVISAEPVSPMCAIVDVIDWIMTEPQAAVSCWHKNSRGVAYMVV